MIETVIREDARGWSVHRADGKRLYGRYRSQSRAEQRARQVQQSSKPTRSVK